LKAILVEVDRKMYLAKQKGRDRLESWGIPNRGRFLWCIEWFCTFFVCPPVSGAKRPI